MKSLVTGASGFVGSAVTRCLLAAGHEVRCLIRPESDQRNLDGLPVEMLEGDLRDIASRGTFSSLSKVTISPPDLAFKL